MGFMGVEFVVVHVFVNACVLTKSAYWSNRVFTILPASVGLQTSGPRSGVLDMIWVVKE